MTAQEEAISTNNIRKHVHKEEYCRIFEKTEKTIAYITRECSSLAQGSYDQGCQNYSLEVVLEAEFSVKKRMV